MNPISISRSRSSNGTAYHRSGVGPPVVLVHGVGLRAESWFPQIGALDKTNTVFAIDLPGHGDSAQLLDASLVEFTKQLGGFVQDVVKEPVVVIGHSLGALVAIDFAVRFPSLCFGVAALNAIYQRSEQARNSILARVESLNTGHDIASAPLKRWFGDSPIGNDEDMAGLCRSWLESADLEAYAAAYLVFADCEGPSAQVLGSLAMPSLFLTGADDPNSTPEMSSAMADLAIDGEAVSIEKARHLVQLTHPHEVNRALTLFVQRCAESHNESEAHQ